ncbi:MAG TPA: helix-turn-helix transcriptional regulator [Kribbella sp.]
MFDLEPTVRSRELGLVLSRKMSAIDMSQGDLARELDWSPSMVSRMISGKRPVSAELMSGVFGVLRITGAERRRLMAIARRVTQRGWWQEFGNRLPVELTTLVDQEDSATGVVAFEPGYVPALLRTPEYMTALMTVAPSIPGNEIDARVRASLVRQRIFDRKRPADFLFLVDEYALCRTGAGRDIMSSQVHHLLRMSVRPNIDLRVVPEAEGCLPAGVGTGFQLMEFAQIKPVVYVEHETSVLFLEREDTVTGYQKLAAELTRIALDETQTRTWLTTVAERLEAPE